MIFPDRLSCNCSRQALSDWIYSDRVHPQWGSQGTPGSPEAKHWVAHLASPLPDKDTFLSSEAVNSQTNQHFPYLGDHVTTSPRALKTCLNRYVMDTTPEFHGILRKLSCVMSEISSDIAICEVKEDVLME